jgi:glycerol-3-phosphate acyltransferase PlsY
MITIFLASFLAYLFGSISSAIIVCKLMGLPDPRREGSKNPGATNVLRIGGKGPAVITLLGDVLKGALPVFIAKWYGLTEIGICLVASFAFIGHIFPVFFKFEGGKGVATALGALIVLNWLTAISWLLTWIISALLFRYASLSSLIASILAPFYISYFTHDPMLTKTITFMSLIIIIRHFENISKLIAGKEKKIGQTIEKK